MQCPACHEPVAVWVAFCPHCGARQGPEQEATEPAATEAIASTDADASHESSLTAELFGGVGDATPADPMPVVEAPAAEHAGYAAAPAAGVGAAGAAGVAGAAGAAGASPRPAFTPPPHEPEWTDWDEDEPPRRGAAAWLIGVAAAFVVLALGFVVWSMMRVDGSDQASNSPTASTTTSARPTPGDSSAAPSTTPSATPSPAASSPSPPATPVGDVPAGAVSCGVSGTGDAAAVFAKDANTSCPFAVEVGNAYRAANSAGSPASITAKSPVTGKDYNLVCTGVMPTTCVADTGATVYLTRAG